MKKSIIIIISFICLSFTISGEKRGLYEINISLADGDTYDLLENVYNPEYIGLFSLNIEYFNGLKNTALIRSFDTENNNFEDIENYMSDSYYDYFNIIPEYTIRTYRFEVNGTYDNKKYSEFDSYYHRLFQSKMVRNILFNKSMDFLFNQCKSNPSDFKEIIINELKSLLAFSSTLKLDSYKHNREFEDYLEGFIYRRYFVDKVPLSEIQSYLTQSISKINQIDASILPYSEYKVMINKNVIMFYRSKEIILTNPHFSKFLSFKHNSSVLSKVKCFKDSVSEFYKFSGITIDKNNSPFTFTIDKNLNLIE